MNTARVSSSGKTGGRKAGTELTIQRRHPDSFNLEVLVLLNHTPHECRDVSSSSSLAGLDHVRPRAGDFVEGMLRLRGERKKG